MTLLLLFLQISFANTESKADSIVLESGIRLENNPSYRDTDQEPDAAIYIAPSLDLLRIDANNSYYLGLDAVYNKYMANPFLDRFEYALNAGLNYQLSDRWSINPNLDHELITEPVQAKSLDIIQRNKTGVVLNLHYNQDDITNHYFDVYGDQHTFQNSEFDYMNNQTIGVNYELEYFFLPETAFITQIHFDSSVFPEGRRLREQIGPSTNQYLNNSVGYKVAAGLEGRLTQYSSFSFIFGYYVRAYEFDDNFNEPVFSVNFQEQITPQDTLIAGYNYQVIDSYYTNYELNQQMYLGYSRVFGDRFIVLFRSNYMYKSYSLVNRREDQKLYGTVQVDYSYRPNWLMKVGFSGDFLISDAFNKRDDAIDPAASYQAYQLYFATKVVF